MATKVLFSCYNLGKLTRTLFVPSTLIVVLFCTFCLPIQAKNIRFNKLSVNDGLPDNQLRSIIQDDLGYIWFGTELGLARYDGYTLKSYLADNDNPHTIADSYILALEVDENNVLWVSGTTGLSRYNRDTDDFSVFVHDENNPDSLSSNTIRAIRHDKNSVLWVATDKGLDQFDTINKRFNHFTHSPLEPSTLPSNKIKTLLITKKGDLWVGTDKGLALYNRASNSFELIKLQNGKQPIIRSLAENKSEEIWIGTHEGLFLYKPSQTSIKKIQFEKEVKYILSTLVDFDGNLWIGTYLHGIFRIDGNHNIINFKSDKSNPTALSENMVLSLYQDQSNIIWVGTGYSGVNSFNPDNLLLGTYDNSANSLACLPTSDIRSALALGDNKMLFGTLSGLTEVNLAQKTCKNYTSNSNSDNSLSNNEVYAMAQDMTGQFWIGTNEGLDKFDPVNGIFERFEEQSNIKAVNKISNQKGYLILGTFEGLRKVKLSTGKISEFSTKDKKLKKALIYNIEKDENGINWVASNQGLLSIDNQLTQVHQVSFLEKSFNNKQIHALAIDKSGAIWITIENEGLFNFQPETKTLKAVGKQLGLKKKTGFTGLYVDNFDNLWLATANEGLFMIDKARKKLTNFHVSDGLQSEAFNYFAFTQTPKGTLLFGGADGFNLFDPTKIKNNKTPPQVSLIQLKRFGKTVVPHQNYDGLTIDKHISELVTLNLTHRDTMFGFDFVAIHYVDPDKISYAYQLEGFDQDWVTTSAQNRGVTYNNVSPGDYVFRMKAQTKNGVWSEDDVALKIHISPAPWLTWWAFTLYALSLILSIFVFIKKRTQLLEQRAQHLQTTVARKTSELVTEKQKVELLLSQKNEEFANISHEFRTPLTLILGPLSQALKRVNDEAVLSRLNIVQRNGYRLLRMVDQLLNLETFRVKAITQRSPQAVGKTIKLLADAFTDLAEEKNIKLRVEDIVDVNFEFTADALEKIILNLLSNAIKYTKTNGTISISSSRTKNNELNIQVSDTGIGIPADKLDAIFERYNRVLDENSERIHGAGIGLALIKNLVETHHGRIEVNSELGQGTTFNVILPIIGEVDANLVNSHNNKEVIAMELMGLTQQTKPIAEHLQPTNPVQNDDKQSVLVIEDNQDMRDYIVTSIGDEYRVLNASNGKEGLDLAIVEVPDLVISDIMMPIMDGYQVTNELRNNQITNHIPVILLTARGDRESRLKGWFEKADEYLTKPFDVEELKIRLINLLEIRNILKKRFGETVFQPFETTTQNEKPDDSAGTNNKQQQFVAQLNLVLESTYSDPTFSNTEFASKLAMSERQLFRKLKSVLDMTPSDYLRRYRLEKAKQLISQGKSVSFATFEVGFSNPSYFAKRFKAQFGISPSQCKKI